ncbi:M24 family metallopeptidase [Halobellus rubicundus]|uniref:M24 family metallopeptidase n=1 Tax=Halobellus rubicundus TaxID=2996466 RepID=A0ABD5M7U4_9EURY
MPGDDLPERPRIDDGFVEDLLAEPDERGGSDDPVGFVAVGDGADPDLGYLTGFDGPEREYAFVRVADERVLCAPQGYTERARRQFDGRVATESLRAPPGERAAAVLDDALGTRSDADATVLTPATIPHDAAVYLERAGYEPRSTNAVRAARATKAESECGAIRAVQRAGIGAVRHAESILAAADVADGGLRWRDEPLTAERLRREIDADLARRGVRSAGNTVVSAGATTPDGEAADPESAIRRAEPIRIEVAPRGPHGYHGACARTLAVDSDGGWERRAYVAVEAALDAALGEIEPGVDAATVAREADAEVAAFGFDPGGKSARGPLATVHGIGLSARERPFASGAELRPGTVLAVAPSVVDPDEGCVRLGAAVVVTEDGYEKVGDGEPSFAPRRDE